MSEVLYRFYDEKDNLLYIGISNSFYSRANQHNKNSEWFHKASYATLEHYDTREEVEEAEKEAIRTEHPIHNKMHSLRNEKPRDHFESFWDITQHHSDEWHSQLYKLTHENYFVMMSNLGYAYTEHVKCWAIRHALREVTGSGGDEIEGIRCMSCERLNQAGFFESGVKNFWLDCGHRIKGEEE